jgi:adenylate cyclase
MKRPWLFGAGVGVCFVLVYLSGLLELPEVRTLDLRFDLRGARRPEFPIVLVTADDDSLVEMNRQWPWPRSDHAHLIRQIAKGNPLAIGVDILFPEASLPAEDRDLGQAIREAKHVVLASTLRSIATPMSGGITQMRDIVEPPIPIIREGAAAVCSVNLEHDKAGVVHSLELVRAFAGQTQVAFTRCLFNLGAKRLGSEGSSAARLRRMWINFLGPSGTFPTFPYYQVYRGERDPKIFEGKVVLIGVSALSLHDRHPAPFAGASWLPTAAAGGPGRTADPEANLMPGVEIQANALHTLLTDDAIIRLPVFFYLVLILLVSVATAVLTGHLRPLRAIACTLGLAGTYLVISQGVFAWWNLWLEVVPVLLPLMVSAGAVISANYIREERVRHEYARFFSPVVARQIAEDRSGQAVLGKRRRITVLFSDIRGFTSISEGLSPEAVVELLREYFNTMVPIVLKHGGTLDKYVGDALMALFGAPLEQEDHAARAVRAAVEMVAQLPVLSPKWEARSGHALRIGVGINTGDAVVGVMGADHRREYSAIGDTVNLASRLEGVTKEFKTPIVISQYTKEALGGQFRIRELSEVQVKGRTEAVHVFAVEAAAGAAQTGTEQA